MLRFLFNFLVLFSWNNVALGHSQSDYADEIYSKLMNRDFASLESIGTELGPESPLLANGTPAMDAYYRGLSGCSFFRCPNRREATLWQLHNDSLDAWLEAYPDSPRAKLAKSWAAYGQIFAQDHSANDVEYLTQALTLFDSIQELDSNLKKSPAWHVLNLTLVDILDMDRATKDLVFAEALNDAPRYVPIYFTRAGHYCDIEETAQLIEIAQQNFGLERSETLYARIQWASSHKSMFEVGRADWPRMKAGLQALYKKFPEPRNFAAIGSFACYAKDWKTVLENTEALSELPKTSHPKFGSSFYDRCLAIAHIQLRPDEQGRPTREADGDVLTALIKTEPRSVIDRVKNIADEQQRRQAASQTLVKWVEAAPSSVLDVAYELSDGTHAYLGLVLRGAAADGAEETLRWLSRYPDLNTPANQATVIEEWASVTPADAAAYVDNFRGDKLSLVNRVGVAYGTVEPLAAIEWMQGYGNVATEGIREVISYLVDSQPELAETYLSRATPSVQTDLLIALTVKRAVFDSAAAMAWLDGYSEFRGAALARSTVFNLVVDRDIAAASTMYLHLDQRAAGIAMSNFARIWSRKDMDALEGWAWHLTSGYHRDYALKEIGDIYAQSMRDFDKALEFYAQIDDPETNRSALHNILPVLFNKYPDRIQIYIDELELHPREVEMLMSDAARLAQRS